MHKPKILLVDDRRENLFTLETILDDLIVDVELVAVTSGNDAVIKSMEDEYALILMDVQMPGMDGFEAMSLVHKSPLNKDTPVIFLSAIYSDDSYKIRGIMNGAVDFITKPIVEDILIGKVNVFLLMDQQKHRLIDQMNEILRLNRDMENFDKILAHDLKQPLTVIQGAISVMISDAENISEDTNEWLNTVQQSADSMLVIIDEVLELIKAKSTELELRQVNPVIVIKGIREIFMKFNKKQININIEPMPEILTHVTLFSSVFRNLIGNSIKYNENEKIEILISYTAEAESHKFHVKDNGIGISPDKFNEVFQPFKRVNASGKYPGTGVGLSIVQSAMDILGGSVGIENSSNDGTTICIRIPIIDKHSVKAS